jgi:hypothetical protein
MRPEERDRMGWLLERIQEEKDHSIFLSLVTELNEILDRREKKLAEELSSSSDGDSSADPHTPLR